MDVCPVDPGDITAMRLSAPDGTMARRVRCQDILGVGVASIFVVVGGPGVGDQRAEARIRCPLGAEAEASGAGAQFTESES